MQTQLFDMVQDDVDEVGKVLTVPLFRQRLYKRPVKGAGGIAIILNDQKSNDALNSGRDEGVHLFAQKARPKPAHKK